MRPLALVATALVTTAAFSGCSRASSNSGPATAPITTISQRYQAAVDPANAALAAMLQRALAYSGGSPAEIDSATPATETSLKNTARQLRGIRAPEPLHRDIVDVMNSMNTLIADLTTLSRAKGNEIQPDIARLVADAGRESASDTLVRLAITQLTSPTTLPAELLVPSTTSAPTTTTTSPRRTTTTRPKTSTTAVRTSTTVVHTTTTKRLTTTTKAATP